MWIAMERATERSRRGGEWRREERQNGLPADHADHTEEDSVQTEKRTGFAFLAILARPCVHRLGSFVAWWLRVRRLGPAALEVFS
jgi:hypothetical protein